MASGARNLPLVPGLDADFELLRELGHGGMAVVYLARERATGREVALKLIRAQFAEDEEVLARFTREAAMVAQLQHPCIVPIHAVRELGDGSVALVMERVPGRTLRESITYGGPFPPGRAEQVLRDIAQALGHAHARGIVHRDVKPENIFVDEETGRAWLADFGIARPIQGDSQLTLTGVAIGTPTYMSPEQIDGPDIDGRSDLYSLGLVGWEMLSGKRPWAGESLYSIIYRQKHDALPPLDSMRGDIPERLLVAVEGLLEKDRTVRWASAEAFLAQLDAAHPTPRRPPPAVPATAPAPTETVQYRRPGREEVEVLLPASASRNRKSYVLTTLVVLVAIALAWLYRTHRVGSSETAIALAADSAPTLRVDPAPPSAVPPAVGVIGGQAGQQQSAPQPTGSASAALPVDTPATTTGDRRRTITFDSASTAAQAPPATAQHPPAARQHARTTADDSTPPATTPDSTTVPVATPAPNVTPHGVNGEATPAASAAVRFAIATGGVDSCLLTPDGQAYCWGGNDQGQLGNGSETRASKPVAVSGGLRFASLSPGLSHSCGTTRSGEGYCWGANEHGQLGSGTRTSSATPVEVAGSWSFRIIETGLSHTCALAQGGGAYCWGNGASGRLGDGETSDKPTPTPVAGDRRFVQLAVGWNHSCALDGGGTAYCWGSNDAGQLGDGTTTDRATPTAVSGGHRFVAIAAGGAHTCALTTDGTAYCWGRNSDGQLGDGSTTSHPSPEAVATSTDFAALTAGGVYSCAITTGGRAECWGRNSDGQLGDGSTSNRTRPVPVAGNHAFAAIHAMGAHTCGTTSAGESFCWGYNVEGQLGDGTRTHRTTPVYIEKPTT